MTSSGNDQHNIDDGIDRKYLARLKQKFLTLNQERYKRTLDALSERQQHFLQLLPLLFHVNHPMLPGYISHQTPAGIQGYTPDKNDIRIAKIIARSFTFQRDLADKSDAIEAIYIMGSLGTIAQAENSDIDVWVCHQHSLSDNELNELQQKCEHLTRWAGDVIHIETHFFLMDAQKFSQGQQNLLTSEASGSAQHFLLLDEFYRTAVWLAGKVPLWWFVPVTQESHYENYTKNLLEKRFIRTIDVIDFGGVPHIPTNEFIGAGVWQLYKGIDSPYKSVLKLLLLEAYANKQFSEPLSLELKRNIYDANPQTNKLDAYVLIYQRLEAYLLTQNQNARLELVRRCFYFKAGKSLSKNSRNATRSWQRLLLENLISQWGWNHHQLTMLDNRAYWKSPHVIAERNLLANELSQAYRLLVDINKHSHNDAAISSDEMLILGRKLHAAFERKAGKIDWINPHISQDLSEQAICFVESMEDGLSLWQIYRGSQQDLLLRNQAAEPVKRSRNFIELLLWCYCNGILAINTKLDIVSKHFSLQASQHAQLLQTLQQWLPLPPTKPAHEAFLQNAQPQRILLILNLGVEPQAELHKKGMQMLSNQRDAFGYSGFKENLLMSADIVQSNSWGEIVCRHFATDAIVNCLLHYLRLIPSHKQSALPELSIRCFSLGQGSTIEQRVMALWRAVINCFYSNTRARQTRFLFEMADEYFLLQIIQQQPQILRFKTYEKLLEKLRQPQLEFSPIVVDAFALRDHHLRLICETVKQPGIYLFYKIEQSLAQVTIVDNKGAFFTKTFTLFNVATLLRPLCRFIRSAVERQSLEHETYSDNTNGIENLQHIYIYELLGDARQKNIRLEPRNISQDVSQLPFINICAVAEPGNDEILSFTIYCDGKEFSALEYGSQLLNTVANYIISRRQPGELYPCYITDIDLSLCRELIAPQTGLQLIHYLQIKDELEIKLNAAIHINN